MTITFIVFLIGVSLASFFSGFLVARQLRALDNVPHIHMIFFQRKLLMGVIIGIFMSGLVMFIPSIRDGFSVWTILGFILMSFISATSYYVGVTLGWGNPLPVNENAIPINPNSVTTLPNNVVVDDTLNSVKITINTKKRWGWFVMLMLQWVVAGLCMFPIAGLLLISILQNYLPQNMNVLVWILVGGLVLYILYTKFQEALEYVFDKEIIEVDNLSVKIEQHGLGFKNRKEYSANNIKKITTMFSLGGTNVVIRRSPFINSSMPAFMIWFNTGLNRYRSFGRAVDLADAQNILETIYSKFPQYKG